MTKITIGLLGILLAAIIFAASPIVVVIFTFAKVIWMVKLWQFLYMGVFLASVAWLAYALLQKKKSP